MIKEKIFESTELILNICKFVYISSLKIGNILYAAYYFILLFYSIFSEIYSS